MTVICTAQSVVGAEAPTTGGGSPPEIRETAGIGVVVGRGWDDNVFTGTPALRAGFSEAGLEFAERIDGDGFVLGAEGRGSYRLYDRSEYEPEVKGDVAFFAETALGEVAVLRGTIEAETKREIDERSRRIAAILRAGVLLGDGEFFSRTEIGESRLNEPNILFGFDFLPEDQRFRQAAQTFGYEIDVAPGIRLGASVLGLETRTPDGPDYLGLRRANRRIQGNFLFTLAAGSATFEGSLSYARVHWPDKDFRPLDALLYDVALSAGHGPLTATLAARREIEDTTFPLASVLLTREMSARLDYAIPYRNASVGAYVKRTDDRLVGIEITGASLEYGADGRVSLTEATSLTASVKRTRALGLDGLIPDRTVATLGLLYKLQ